MAIELTDTHCHIQSAGSLAAESMGERVTREKWSKIPDRTPDVIISDAKKHDVTRMICVGCDKKDSQLAIDFAADKPECWASIGIHPHEAQHFVDQQSDLDDFAALAGREKVVAVGECGLDYYYGHSPQADQAKILRFQIELALQHDLPMIFHVRGASSAEPGKDAFQDFWPVFDSYNGIRGVLHSFTDSSENLDKALERNLYIGVNGIATFTRDPAQVKMYKSIPKSRLLLETDAPFLTPSPYRGTICEPYHINVIANFLAELRGESLEDLAGSTTDNALALFRLR
jgi:TatD DNase family protein